MSEREDVDHVIGDGTLIDQIYNLTVANPMWIGDDGEPLDYLPERESLIGDFLGDVRELLSAHVEAVRVSERVRLAGEVEALRSALDRTEHNFCLAVQGKPVRDMAENLGENKAARVLTAGVRLTEEP